MVIAENDATDAMKRLVMIVPLDPGMDSGGAMVAQVGRHYKPAW
ncbi:MAG: hypothetical protein U1F09_15185 [Steroidobacteraceae bacterium]